MNHRMNASLLALCLSAATQVANAKDYAAQVPSHLAPCQGSVYPFPQECGKVAAIVEKSAIGQSNGVGAVVGGVGGYLIGKKVTKSTLGRIAMTGAGAAAGNYAQRQISSTKHWLVEVRFNDGRTMDIKSHHEPVVRLGDVVRVHNGQITWSAAAEATR